MHPSSTGTLLGVPLLVIHPFKVLPSKMSCQPCRFSFEVSSLSFAEATTVKDNKRPMTISVRPPQHPIPNTQLRMRHFLLLRIPHHHPALTVRLHRHLYGHHCRTPQLRVARDWPIPAYGVDEVAFHVSPL